MGWKKSSAKPKRNREEKMGFGCTYGKKPWPPGCCWPSFLVSPALPPSARMCLTRVLRLLIFWPIPIPQRTKHSNCRCGTGFLEESAGLLDGVKGLEEAQERVEAAMPVLLEAAQDEISQRGYDYSVSMELAPTAFNTRVYGDVTLPAEPIRPCR